MILVFGVWLGWLPVAGYVPLESGLWPNLRSLIMPAVSLGLVQSALIARITRSSMLDVLREQYILAGRSKGLSERVVVYKHALKNAIIPTLTVIGITFAILVGRRGRDRDGVQHPRARPAHHLRRAPARLPGDPGRGAADRRRLHAGEPAVDLAYLALDPRIRYRMSTGRWRALTPDRAPVAAPAESPKWLGVRVFLRRKTAVVGVVLVVLTCWWPSPPPRSRAGTPWLST